MTVFELSIACYALDVILPPLVELLPLSGPVQAKVTIPGSKSITNRARLLAALFSDPVTLHGALSSDDTEIMAGCLEKLGISISFTVDPLETGDDPGFPRYMGIGHPQLSHVFARPPTARA